MGRRPLSLDKFTESIAAFRQYMQPEETDRQHKMMLYTLKNTIEGELTEKQRECVELYYFQGKRMSEIAQELGIEVCTVSKRLTRARKRLGKIMGYYFVQ